MSVSAHNSQSRFVSGVMYAACVICTVVILSLLVLVTAYLVSIGWQSLHWSFFTQDPIPLGLPGAPGGMRNAVLGTLMLIALASIVGVPMGVLTGIYLSEYQAGAVFTRPVRFVCDVLAGVPSIVVGVLGYALLVAPAAAGWFSHIPVFSEISSFNGWAGALALAFIMIPIIARTTEEMLSLVPSSYREASVALGATKASTIIKVVLPSATASIVTGVMLAIARVAGETAPLLFTALNSDFMPVEINRHFPFIHPLLGQPFPSLTVTAFNYARDIDPDRQKLAWAGILVLIMLVFAVNLSVRLATRRRRKA
ncbi:MAG TPA: phosphate ABC transporter permease PstA [Tepidisphaeraceae bacterium]|nr:phosphate ABC transporter permease PstA [Tepidisphaeraceae bacterium]